MAQQQPSIWNLHYPGGLTEAHWFNEAETYKDYRQNEFKN